MEQLLVRTLEGPRRELVVEGIDHVFEGLATLSGVLHEGRVRQ